MGMHVRFALYLALALAAVVLLCRDASAQTLEQQNAAIRSLINANNRTVARVTALEGRVNQLEAQMAIRVAEIARLEIIVREHRAFGNALQLAGSNLTACWNALIAQLAAGARLSPPRTSEPVVTFDPNPANWRSCIDRNLPAPQWPTRLAELPAG